VILRAKKKSEPTENQRRESTENRRRLLRGEEPD
jgi:hypothetical protein